MDNNDITQSTPQYDQPVQPEQPIEQVQQYEPPVEQVQPEVSQEQYVPQSDAVPQEQYVQQDYAQQDQYANYDASAQQNPYAPQDQYANYDPTAQQSSYDQQNSYDQQANYEQPASQDQYANYDASAQQNPYVQQDQYAQQNQYSTYDPQNPYAAQNPYGTQDSSNGYGPYGPQNGGQQNGYGPYGPQNGGQQNGYGPYGPQNGGQNTFGGSQDVYGANTNPNQPGGPGTMKQGLSKKGKTILFSIIGAVLLVGLALFLIFGVFYTPKKRLKAAMEANKQTDYRYFNTPFDEVLGTGEIIKTFDEKGGSFDIRVGFNEVDGEKSFDGIGFNGNIDIDRAAKQLAFDFIIDDEGKAAFDGQLLADEDTTYLTIKDVLDGYIAFDNKDFAEKLKNSFLADSDELKGFEELPIKDIDYFSEGGFLKRDNGVYTQIAEKFWDAAEVKTSGSETLELGGKSVKCKTYKVTIKKDDAKRILDETIEQYIEEALSDENADNYLNSAGISDPEELKAQVKALFDTMITEDIIYKAYVKGGHVVGYTAEGTLNLMGTQMKYDLMIKNTGDKNVTASGETTLVLTVQGIAVNMYAKYGSAEDGSAINSYFNGKISLAGSAITMDINQRYDTASGLLDITGNMSSSGRELMSFSGNGSITDVTKGKSFTYNLDHFAMESYGEKLFDMNVKCKISTEANVERPDSSKRVVNVFYVSKAEFEQFMKDNEKNLDKLKEDMQPIIDKLQGIDDD